MYKIHFKINDGESVPFAKTSEDNPFILTFNADPNTSGEDNGIRFEDKAGNVCKIYTLPFHEEKIIIENPE